MGILLVGFLKVVVGEIYGVSRDGDWRSYIRKAIWVQETIKLKHQSSIDSPYTPEN